MGLIAIPDDRTIFICGQLSNDPDNFSMPFAGTAILHPKAGTADLFFSAFVEGEPNNRTQRYDYLTLQDIYNKIGAKDLVINAPQTVVTLTRNNLNPGVLGRCGLKLNIEPDKVTGGIARLYAADLSLPGTWGLSDSLADGYNVIRYGDQYSFIVAGAKLEV